MELFDMVKHLNCTINRAAIIRLKYLEIREITFINPA